jgi:SulP family sulfate permease
VLVNFVSDSVIIGLTAGAGLLIFANQLKHLLRLTTSNSPYFFVTLWDILRRLPQLHWLSLGLGLLTILIILGVRLSLHPSHHGGRSPAFRRITSRIPMTLVALIVVTALVGIFDLEAYGVLILG